MAIGEEIYVSAAENKSTITKLEDKEGFTIDPGQFAFLLTEESVELTNKTIGFISIRASIKFLGLVNVSGFHVDPGYSGKLIFAVFNAGPTRIHLKRSDRIFMLWLPDLTAPAPEKEKKDSYSDIPSKVVSPISGLFTTAYQVQKQVDDLKKDIAELKSFKLYAMVIIGIVILFLVPTLKDNFQRIVQPTNPAQSAANGPG